jgi:hypothetical protein
MLASFGVYATQELRFIINESILLLCTYVLFMYSVYLLPFTQHGDTNKRTYP